MITEKKLSLSDLKAGMTVARDIVDMTNGEVLVKKDSILTADDINKLTKYQIKRQTLKDYQTDSPANMTMRFWEEEAERIEEQKILAGESLPHLQEKERETFVKFRQSYSRAEKEAQEYIQSIDGGEPIELSKLFAPTDGIIKDLNIKSDVFMYLSYLKKQQEDYIFAHSINVSLLCHIFGKWLDFSDEDCFNLTTAGILHDIGKVKVDFSILSKHGKLTDYEFAEMKKHPVYGYDTLRYQDIPDEIKLATLEHHERVDGSGYPRGLKEGEISRLAKIVAICDVYEAMVSERPYRKKHCPFDVIREFERQYYGKLDTEYLMVFLKNIAYNYLNRKVQMSNGEVGEVVFINNLSLSRPIVQLQDGKMVDLMRDKSMVIESVL